MRTLVLASFAAVALLASTARAEDTKPPAISDVKASAKGGKVNVEARITDETGVLSAIVHHRGPGGSIEDTQMQKNDYDDIFKASFPGSAETEYWIESSDLLGNGPSTYGSAGKPFTASGNRARAEEPQWPPRRRRGQRSSRPPRNRRPGTSPPRTRSPRCRRRR
jgi:hypothetical protein